MIKDKELVRIFTGHEVSVILLKRQLEELEITAQVRNDLQSGLSAGFGGGFPSAIELYIQQADLARAEPIIATFIENNKDAS